MAVTAKGFDQTLTEVDWAKLSVGVGVPYCVVEGMELAAYTTASATAGAQSGVAVVYGVRVELSSAELLVLPIPTTGSRWDLIALRVNWDTNSASVVAVTGGSSPTLPPGRQQTVGAAFDMPLMLARVEAGQNRIMEYIDLRVFASKMLQAADVRALPPTMPGGRAVVAGTPYHNPDGLAWVAGPDVTLAKAANTSYSSSSAYTTDTELQAVVAAGVYAFNATILADSTDTVSDVYATIIGGSWSARSIAVPRAATSSADALVGGVLVNVASGGVGFPFGTGPWQTMADLSGRIQVSTGGTVGLQFKKDVGGAAIQILRGSTLRLTRVGA